METERQKELRKAWRQRPDVKARLREHNKARRNRPEVKARRKELDKAWRNRPDVKARKKEYQRAWYQRPGVKARQSELKKASRKRRIYGITVEDFHAMLENQAGLCAMCTEPMRPGRGTCIDHDHTTGKVRGLLCLGCNFALGPFERNLSDAMAYLIATGSLHVASS